jgi:hypothetical protein
MPAIDGGLAAADPNAAIDRPGAARSDGLKVGQRGAGD